MSLEPEAELFTDSSPFLERGGPVEAWETETARRNPCYLSTFANHAAVLSSYYFRMARGEGFPRVESLCKLQGYLLKILKGLRLAVSSSSAGR